MSPHIHIGFGVDDRPSDVQRLVEYCSSLFTLPIGADWTLDLTDCSYLGPDGAAIVMSIVDRARRTLGQHPCVHLPTKPPALDAFCAFSGLKHFINKGERPKEDHRDCETVPLKQFFENPQFVAGPAVTLVRRHMPSLSTDAEDFLRICIAEVAQNVIDHAESPIGGFLCARYFSGRHEVRVAIVDQGRTIPVVVNQQQDANLSHRGALEKALRGGWSSRSRSHNRGQGLRNLADIVRNFGGSLFLVSGEALAVSGETPGTAETRSIKAKFPGTGVFFTMNVED